MSNLNDIAAPIEGAVKSKTKVGVELPAKKTLEELAYETAQLEHEEKQLSILEKKAHLQDLHEQLAERELRRESKRSTSITNGATLTQLAHNDASAQKRCNHRKGGNGAQGLILGQGHDSQHAVIKHTFANGDMWIRCMRCGKTWKPVMRENCKSDEDYLRIMAAYEAAVNFQTNNTPSGSIQFRFTDGGDFYRKVTASSTLR
jgi:hypothetical protein